MILWGVLFCVLFVMSNRNIFDILRLHRSLIYLQLEIIQNYEQITVLCDDVGVTSIEIRYLAGCDRKRVCSIGNCLYLYLL